MQALGKQEDHRTKWTEAHIKARWDSLLSPAHSGTNREITFSKRAKPFGYNQFKMYYDIALVWKQDTAINKKVSEEELERPL